MAKINRGILITFEGIEGCGKTTQLKILAEYLQARGIGVVKTREPGGTILGEKIRRFLLNPDHNEISEFTELFLYAASRAQHIHEVIGPAIKKKQIVLSDRFIDSTVAYQGYGRGIDFKVISEINGSSFFSRIKPVLTFVLDLPVKKGFERVMKRKKTDRIENESLRFHEKVRKGYLEMARSEPERIKIISAVGNKHETAFLIRKQIDSLLDIN